MTETFDFRDAGAVKLAFYRLTRAMKTNAAGIEASLTKLRERYATPAH